MKRLLAAACVLLAANGASAQSGGAVGRRKAEREKENWYFSDVLNYKSRSRDLDLLYRFYTRSGDGAAPRVEPSMHASLSTGLIRPVPPNGGGSFGGIGYGASVHFNHFVSGFTGLPTPNIVPGVFGERLEENGAEGPGLSTRWGPSLRLLARNQQDLAVYLRLRIEKGVLWGRSFRTSQAEVTGLLFLLPFFGIEAGTLIGESFLKVSPDPLASRGGFHVAPFIEVGVFRLRARFERDNFTERAGAALPGSAPRSLRQERRTLSAGFAL